MFHTPRLGCWVRVRNIVGATWTEGVCFSTQGVQGVQGVQGGHLDYKGLICNRIFKSFGKKRVQNPDLV